MNLLTTPFLAIGPLGTQEMIIIGFLILLLFGAKKLPQLARGVGKSMGEFRRAKDEFERELTTAKNEIENETSDIKRPISTPGSSQNTGSSSS